MNINKAIIAGRITRKPELKSLPSGVQVASFSVATNQVWKDKSGEKKESTEFHNVVVFGRQAESCAQYLDQGQVVLLEGRIQTRTWDGQDGKKNYRTEIVADRVQFGQKSQSGSAGSTGKTRDEGAQAPAPADVPTIEYPEEDINVDDIPF